MLYNTKAKRNNGHLNMEGDGLIYEYWDLGNKPEHMKFSAFGKFGRFHDHLRMVNNKGYRRSNTALAIIAELGSESNAHGLAKIATTEKTKRKVIWALLVIVGFTAATLQLSLLVKKYLQFNVVEVSQMRDGMPVEFPSVTICNTHAMALTKVKARMNSVPDYQKWFMFLSQVSFGKELQTRVESTQGFYENMMSEVPFISHDINEILVHCRFNQKECFPSNFTKHFDGKNYYNCFTFNSAPNSTNKVLMHSTGPQNGLSMVISLDNDDPPLGAYGLYNIHDNIAHSAGIRVQVHAPNTMPSPVDHGFDVPPGYSSSIGLKAIMHTRRGSPHGNCTTNNLDGKETYRNTIFSCLQMCKQHIVIEKCGCKSSGLPDVNSVKMPNLTYCGTIKNWRDIYNNLSFKNEEKSYLYLKSLKCEEDTLHELTNNRSYEVKCKCFQPCSETTYQKSLSLSYWPLEFYQYEALRMFYKDRIQQTFMHDAYKYLNHSITKYEHLYMNQTEENQSKMLASNISLQERQGILRATNLIHQNLLRLNIYLEDLSVVEFMQMPAYELADLFADIGGTLGLWMGISVLTVMELIELIVRLIMLLFNSENKMPDHRDPVTNGMLDHTDNYPDAYQKTDFEAFDRNDYGRTLRDNPNDLPV